MYKPLEIGLQNRSPLIALSILLTSAVFFSLAAMNVVSTNKILSLQIEKFENNNIPPPPGSNSSLAREFGASTTYRSLIYRQPPGKELIAGKEDADLTIPVFPVLETAPKHSFAQVAGEHFIHEAENLDIPPIPLIRINPKYPADLKFQRLEGKVVALLSVDEEGQVFKVEIEKSDFPQFSHSVVAALLKWRFVPGKIEGRYVRFKMRQPVIFKLVKKKSSPPQYAQNIASPR